MATESNGPSQPFETPLHLLRHGEGVGLARDVTDKVGRSGPCRLLAAPAASTEYGRSHSHSDNSAR